MVVGERAMKLGVALPLSNIGGDPATVRLFAQAAEAGGYDHLAAPDHVLGINVREPAWLGRAEHLGRCLPRSFRPVRISERVHDENRLLDTSAHPAPAANRAGRQA